MLLLILFAILSIQFAQISVLTNRIETRLTTKHRHFLKSLRIGLDNEKLPLIMKAAASDRLFSIFINKKVYEYSKLFVMTDVLASLSDPDLVSWSNSLRSAKRRFYILGFVGIVCFLYWDVTAPNDT